MLQKILSCDSVLWVDSITYQKIINRGNDGSAHFFRTASEPIRKQFKRGEVEDIDSVEFYQSLPYPS